MLLVLTSDANTDIRYNNQMVRYLVSVYGKRGIWARRVQKGRARGLSDPDT